MFWVIMAVGVIAYFGAVALLGAIWTMGKEADDGESS